MELKDEWIQQDVVLENPLLKITLKGMMYYGIVLYKSQSKKVLSNFLGICFTISILAFNITQYVDLYQVWGNFSEMTVNASTTLFFTSTITRLLHFYWNRSKFNTAIRRADEMIRQVLHRGNEAEKRTLTGNVKYMKRLTAVFWICCMVTPNIMYVSTLLQYFFMHPTEHQPTVMRSWYPESKNHFAILYCIQLYILCICQLIIPCWHMFVISLMVFVRTMLLVLNYKLSHLEHYEISELSDDLPVRKPQECPKATRCSLRKKLLIECIRLQCDIYDFTHELEKLTKSSMFMDFVVFSVLLCLRLFEISVTDSTVQVLIDVCVIMVSIAIIFLYYWHANEISYHANSLSNSAFSSDWYNYPRSVNRYLITIICYSMKPLTMKAYFVMMSLNTFISILRASYSYFTILKQVIE
ncbi:odorant receptor 56a-like [Malaya genurostris]|uniref:odorant receptor 56a-like n=1 Tax=Malaya genurostris TaxID=325434 RepID=UPI0026F3B226|nr:odorant receptor 56a-like [Malaya genurostris]